MTTAKQHRPPCGQHVLCRGHSGHGQKGSCLSAPNPTGAARSRLRDPIA